MIYDKHNSRTLILFFIFVVLIMGCAISPSVAETDENIPDIIALSPMPAENVDTPPVPDDSITSPSVPTPTAVVPVEHVSLLYNLPQAILTETSGLYASPNRIETVVSVQLQPGDVVYVMGRNATGSHLRVVWNTGVGWIPVSFTDVNANRDKLNSFPIFTMEPPACAVPLVTQFSLNSEWVSDNSERQRIAVVVELFRTRYGDFPSSFLVLAVNNQEIKTSKREIVERGQFSLKDVVFSLPGYIFQGDKVSYVLHTDSDEPLAFLATIFSIPENCVWDID